MTQQRAILNYMRENGTITPMEAFSELGITKLATRISELTKQGIQIEKERVAMINRYGNTTIYMKYRLKV